MPNYDATKAATFNLFQLNNAQLLARGLSAQDVAELRQVQREAPPARTVEEVRAALASREAADETPQPLDTAPSIPRRVRSEVTGMASGTHSATENS